MNDPINCISGLLPAPWQPFYLFLPLMTICKFFQQGHCRKGVDCGFEHIRDGKKTSGPFLNNSRDNIQQNSPPRRKSNRINKKSAGGSSHENLNLQVTKSHGQTHENKLEGSKKGKNDRNKNKNIKNNKKNNYFTKLPSYRPPQTAAPSTEPRVPGIKDYVDMVMTDLSTRPQLWHFSSYGLSLSSTQSLPFPHLGTVELSAEELRLQVYAEAAATGGRIDNYLKVVGEIKEKAEAVTKALIPNLEQVISETLRANNISLGSYQQNLRLALQHQASQANYPTHQVNYSAAYNPSVSQASYNLANSHQIPQHEPPLIQHPTIQYQLQPQQIHQSNEIIPDDSFSFGMIPEIPPE